MAGRFIVFEGVEGAGKTTQIQQAVTWLEHSGWGHRLATHLNLQVPIAVVTREPGGTQLGKHIRKLLLDPALSATEEVSSQAELLLYSADRAQHVTQYIRPHLEAGHIVFCDRFTDSTVAYQGYGRKLDLTLIQNLNQIATLGLRSDLTLWFDVDVTQGLARAKRRQPEHTEGDRMEANDLAFHQRVQTGFAALAQQNALIHRINANQSLDEVTQQVKSILAGAFQQWYPNLLSNS